jgi:hypothetical protein
MYKGGRNVNGKTTTVKKEQVWKQLSELITQKGIWFSIIQNQWDRSYLEWRWTSKKPMTLCTTLVLG